MKAEQAIQEQMLKILKESAEKKQREEEELRAKLVGDVLQEKLKMHEEEYRRGSREKAEKKCVWLFGKQLCMAVTAMAGGAIGAGVGLLGPAAVNALKTKCSLQ